MPGAGGWRTKKRQFSDWMADYHAEKWKLALSLCRKGKQLKWTVPPAESTRDERRETRDCVLSRRETGEEGLEVERGKPSEGLEVKEGGLRPGPRA